MAAWYSCRAAIDISGMLRLFGERIMCARIAGCKLPHLFGDIAGEGPVAQIAGKRLHCFDPQKGLRPSVRGGIRPEFGYAVAQHRASLFGLPFAQQNFALHELQFGQEHTAIWGFPQQMQCAVPLLNGFVCVGLAHHDPARHQVSERLHYRIRSAHERFRR